MKPSKVDWMLLRLAMAKKNREMEMSIDNYLDERCSDFLRQLKHDVECCSDPKSFYEKEIPYRMENLASSDLRHITTLMSQGFANNLVWLQTNLRRFGISKFEIPFSEYSLVSGDYNQNKLDLLDTHKARLYTRAGTLITVLCLSGYGSAVLIGSILFGAGADELLSSSNKKSKERIIAVLPRIVQAYKSHMRLRIVEAINKPCMTIINTLNNINYERNELQ
jgi:hypothetical protein